LVLVAIKDVTAFVDWQSQLIASKFDYQADPVGAARLALERTARSICACLRTVDSAHKYRVQLRLYHGWYKGFESTVNRKAVKEVGAKEDFSYLSTHPSIVFRDDLQFGDRLLDALEERAHAKPSIHLPNTLRARRKNEPPEEKMVDTALAADLLCWAKTDPSQWAIVVAEDDDFVPPLFVAESWIKRHGGRALLVCRRPHSQTFLKLDGILIKVPPHYGH
jgi:hypothetical protein